MAGGRPAGRPPADPVPRRGPLVAAPGSESGDPLSVRRNEDSAMGESAANRTNTTPILSSAFRGVDGGGRRSEGQKEVRAGCMLLGWAPSGRGARDLQRSPGRHTGGQVRPSSAPVLRRRIGASAKNLTVNLELRRLGDAIFLLEWCDRHFLVCRQTV